MVGVDLVCPAQVALGGATAAGHLVAAVVLDERQSAAMALPDDGLAEFALAKKQ